MPIYLKFGPNKLSHKIQINECYLFGYVSEISRMHNQADQADYAADRWSGMIRRQVVMIRPAPKLIRQRWPLIRPGPAVQ